MAARLWSTAVLPEREQSRMAAGPYVSRMRSIWAATSPSASSHEIRSHEPEPLGPTRRMG